MLFTTNTLDCINLISFTAQKVGLERHRPTGLGEKTWGLVSARKRGLFCEGWGTNWEYWEEGYQQKNGPGLGIYVAGFPCAHCIILHLRQTLTYLQGEKGSYSSALILLATSSDDILFPPPWSLETGYSMIRHWIYVHHLTDSWRMLEAMWSNPLVFCILPNQSRPASWVCDLHSCRGLCI